MHMAALYSLRGEFAEDKLQEMSMKQLEDKEESKEQKDLYLNVDYTFID
jgi:hypothetical protein